jgi:TolB protein
VPILRVAVVAGLVLSWCVLTVGGPVPPVLHAQGGGVDVWLNVQKGGGAKLNIAIPEFTVVRGEAGAGKPLTEVTGRDLAFSGLFSVLSGTAPLPVDNQDIVRRTWSEFAAAGAHAALHGLVTQRDGRLEGEMRLYDLTSPEQRLIAGKKFDLPAAQPRRLAHKIADEVVLQFTGEQGVADTKIAYVHGRVGAKEIYTVDYDGIAPLAVTENRSINLSPAWSPDARSLAFTSYVRGYPDLYRLFVFERRPLQTLSAFNGLNTSPAWSPDGKSVALTVSKDGNPEIYVITVATGAARRLTRHPGIDTEPTWSPTGRQIAFTSDRAGQPNIFVMDDEGANVRPLTFGGFHTQPRWSPRGDVIAYTARSGSHDVWIVSADGGSQRRLTAGPGSNESPSWAPSGRHLAFQSSRLGGWQIFTMQADGSEQQPVTRGSTEATSPSWSPRLP